MKIQLRLIKDVKDKELPDEPHVMKNQIDRIVSKSKALLRFSRMREAKMKINIDNNYLFHVTLLPVEKEFLLKDIEV